MGLSDQVVKFLLTADDQTGKGVSSANAGFDSLKANAGKLTGILGTLGVGVSLAGLVEGLRETVDQMDAAYAAAQKVGLSVESFTALQYAAEMSGIPMEALVSTLGKLNKNIYEAASDKTGSIAKTFAELGVSATDATGKMRDADVVLVDIAERLSALPDGAEKSALAMALFGNSGADLIPLLNEGAAGIAKMTEEAKRLGVVMSTEAAAGADEFNDNLDRLVKQWEGLKIEAAKGLLPTLSQITEATVKASQEADRGAAAWAGFKTGWQVLGNGVKRLLGIEETAVDVKVLADESKKLDKEKSLPRAFRDTEAAAAAAEKAIKEEAAAARAAGEVAKQENEVAKTGLSLALEQAKTQYELAKAKGNTAEATAAKNRITEIENELARLNAQAAIAQAEAAILVAQEKYKEALARNENVDAMGKELEAAALTYKSKVLQGEITEETIGRQKKLKDITDKVASSTGGAAEGFVNMGSAASGAAAEVDKLSDAEQRLLDIRNAANAARGQGGATSWEYLLGAKGIELSTEQLRTFKAEIESIYKYLSGTFDGQVVSSTYLVDEAIRRAVKLATTGASGSTSSGGGASTTTTTRQPTPAGSASAGGITIIVQGDALDADGLARKLQPALAKITRLRS